MKFKTILLAIFVVLVIPYLACRVGEYLAFHNMKEDNYAPKLFGQQSEKHTIRKSAMVYRL